MRTRIAKIIVATVTLFVFGEILSSGWYFANGWLADGRGELFYWSDKPELAAVGEEKSEELVNTTRLHPYFGFIGNPDHENNNHGFDSSSDYPYSKQSEHEYVIGIFGGSVAHNFAIQGKERLIQRLKQAPFFRDKEFVILNYGVGGYKQPQQLLVLNYYLAAGQEFDMVINLDGFNEVALSRINNAREIDISMPSLQHMSALINVIDASTLTTQKIQSLARITRYKSWAGNLAVAADDAHLASEYFLLSSLHGIVSNRYRHEQHVYGQLETGASSMLYSYQTSTRLDGPALFESIAQQWAQASIMMNQVLKGKHVSYYHFLQPNQYYSNRTFDEVEANIALTQNHPYRLGVENGYPMLIAESKTLEQDGVHFFSALGVLDHEHDAVYRDDCCHYNQLGNELLADFVADSILGAGEF